MHIFMNFKKTGDANAPVYRGQVFTLPKLGEYFHVLAKAKTPEKVIEIVAGPVEKIERLHDEVTNDMMLYFYTKTTVYELRIEAYA